MNMFKQLISYILVIQLCISCNGSNGGSSGASGGAAGGGTVTIEGSITQVIRGFSNLIISSAMAQVGDITVYDVADLETPLGTFPVDSEEKYSIELDADLINTAILKFKYERRDAGLKRDLLFDIDEVDKNQVDMNEEKHFEAGILEEQLKNEASDSSDKVAFRSRFKDLKMMGVSEELALFGDSDSMKEILNSADKDYVPEMKKHIIDARKARENGEDQEAIVRSMVELAEKFFNGPLFSSKKVLNCSGERATFFIDDEKTYNFSLVGYDLEVLKAYEEFDGVKPFGQAKTSEDANKILRQMSLDLKKISLEQKKNLSGVVTISDMSENGGPEKTCRLFGMRGESQEAYYFFDLSILNDLSQNDGYSHDILRDQLNDVLSQAKESYWLMLSTIIMDDDTFLEIVGNLEIKKAENLKEAILKNYVAPISVVFNASFMNSVDFKNLVTYDQGKKQLLDALDKTRSDLDEKINQAGRVDEESHNQWDHAQDHFSDRMYYLREYFDKRFDDLYGYDRSKLDSIDFAYFLRPSIFELYGYDVIEHATEAIQNEIRSSLGIVQEKLRNEVGLTPEAKREIQFFQLGIIMIHAEKRFADLKSEFSIKCMEEVDLSKIKSDYNDNLTYQEKLDELYRQVGLAKWDMRNTCKENDDENPIYLAERLLQVYRSDFVVFNSKFLELNICYNGTSGSPLAICQDGPELTNERMQRAK